MGKKPTPNHLSLYLLRFAFPLPDETLYWCFLGVRVWEELYLNDLRVQNEWRGLSPTTCHPITAGTSVGLLGWGSIFLPLSVPCLSGLSSATGTRADTGVDTDPALTEFKDVCAGWCLHMCTLILWVVSCFTCLWIAFFFFSFNAKKEPHTYVKYREDSKNNCDKSFASKFL